MFVLAIIITVILVFYFFWNYWWRIIRTKRCGIETDAVLSRIDGYTSSVGGSEEYPRRFYYASYETESGLQNEARLLNPKASLVIGSKIRIKYLDEKSDYAVLTEIIQS